MWLKTAKYGSVKFTVYFLISIDIVKRNIIPDKN